MDSVLQDLRFALRSIRGNRGFALAVIATLALGIGANTAIFSAVDGVLLRPLPYADADRLAVVSSTFRSRDTVVEGGSSLPDFAAFRDGSRAFSAMTAAYTEDRSLQVAGGAERVRTAVVAPGFFATLGAPPLLGREATAGEDAWGHHRVVVLSHALHRRLFNEDPTVLGRTLTIGGEDYTVIGVAPATMALPAPRQDVFVPISFPPGDESLTRGNHFVQIFGRLAPGATLASARAEIEGLSARMAREIPENANIGVRVASLRQIVSGNLRPGLLVLLGAVGLILLICCANLGNLLLARGSSRARELAVRAALGASRGRLVRQLLTESLLLGLAGGAAGVLLGAWLLDLVLALGPQAIRTAHEVHVDGRVLAFALALSLATGVGFGLLPALLASRGALAASMKEGARGTSGHRGQRLRQALVVAEIALALVLVAGAGLLTRSFAELSRVRLGFDPDGVVTGSVQFPDRLELGARRRFLRDVLARLSSMPGVEAAGVASALPMDGGGWGKYATAEAHPATRLEDVPLVEYRLVAGDAFRALGLRAVSGRGLAAADDAENAPPVAVLNETAARVLFGGADPLGQHIFMAPPEALIEPARRAKLPPEIFTRLTVVGVIADVRSNGPGRPAGPEVYRPMLQAESPWGAAVFARGRGDLGVLLRRAVAETAPDQPIADIQPVTALLGEAVSQPRFHTALVDGFAALALLLALLGVYGVMSYTISQRTQELGIRLALGATPRALVRMVLGRGLLWVAAGLLFGIAGAFAAGRLAAGLLFGISSADPMALLGAIAAVVACAALALIVPARRAARTSPLEALKGA